MGMVDLVIGAVLTIAGTLIVIFRVTLAAMMHRRMTRWYGDLVADHLLDLQRTPRRFAVVGVFAIAFGIVQVVFTVGDLFG